MKALEEATLAEYIMLPRRVSVDMIEDEAKRIFSSSISKDAKLEPLRVPERKWWQTKTWYARNVQNRYHELEKLREKECEEIIATLRDAFVNGFTHGFAATDKLEVGVHMKNKCDRCGTVLFDSADTIRIRVPVHVLGQLLNTPLQRIHECVEIRPPEEMR